MEGREGGREKGGGNRAVAIRFGVVRLIDLRDP